MSEQALSVEEAWLDGIRAYMGKCPLYEGVMLERDGVKELVAPTGLARIKTPRKHKCPFCNVNREGQHQDFCPGSDESNHPPLPRNAKGHIRLGPWAA